MLNVILGDKDFKQYTEGKKYITSTDTFFDIRFQSQWLSDPLVKDILAAVHNIGRVEGTTLYEKYRKTPMDVKEISVCCKAMILIYKFPEIIFLARLNVESLPMLEKIAGFEDITIHAKVAYNFPFQYLDEVSIINYGKTARNTEELEAVYQEFFKYEKERRWY